MQLSFQEDAISSAVFARLFDSPQIYDTTSGAVVYDSIIPHMLSALPDILIGIVVVLVLSASMSTLSSLVLTSSSTMTLDLIKDNVVKNMSEKETDHHHAGSDRILPRGICGDRS